MPDLTTRDAPHVDAALFGVPTAAGAPTAAGGAALPVHLTRFVGRGRELDEIARLLDGARLLTLTGAGGSGKTRLAREAAARATAAGAVDRTVWVDLAALAEPALVPREIATALGGVPRGAESAEGIAAVVGAAPHLLVLDNCEHLVEPCAALVEALLRGCPRLVVLATSREALSVASEVAWLVPPLAADEAEQLFVERARASLPAFTLTAANAPAVREICRRLDGIPLAIELAAARVRVLAPEQIAERLDDAFRLLTTGSRTALPRHRTLRATMEWSHALLGERERVLLRRLSVFAGGFTLDAAEAVGAAPPLEVEDVLDGVAALVDKSLVGMEPGDGRARYRLLETVRQYARERLEEAGEVDAADEAHARHYLHVLETVAPLIVGGNSGTGAFDALGVEHDNLRLAAAWAIRAPGRGAEALRFCDSLFWFWYGGGQWLGTGQFDEARQYIARALRSGADEAPMLRARALLAAGLTAHPQGNYREALRVHGECLALARTLDDPQLLATVLCKLGAAHLMLGDLDAAWRRSDEALAVTERCPPSVHYGFVYFWRSWTALERGALAEARRCADVNRVLGRQLRHAVMFAHGDAIRARVELFAGDDAAAGRHLAEALRTHVAIGDDWGLTLDLNTAAQLARRAGRHDDALRLLGACAALRERAALAPHAVDAPHVEALLGEARARLGDDAPARLEAEGRALSLDGVVALVVDAAPAGATTAALADGPTTGAAGTLPTPAAPFAAVHEEAPSSTAAPAALRVRALGALQVTVDGDVVDATAWGSARTRELLVYLLLHPEGRTKDQVGLVLWPEASPAQLRNSFHVTLHRLRRALRHPEWVELAGDRYRVSPAALAEFDVTAFAREVAEARLALARGTPDAAAALERAVARYRGDLLDGEPAGDWHLEHRDHLQRLHRDALMALAAHHAAHERWARAADACRRLLVHEPLHEEAVRLLMRGHAELGERPQALRAYDRFAARLQDELEAEPDEETQALRATLQRG